MYLYAAAFSPVGTGGYSVYSIDTEAGTASLLQQAFPQISAGTAIYESTSNILYCTDERRNNEAFRAGGGGNVYAIKIDPETGQMSELNHKCSYGCSPSFVAFDKNRRYIVLTNFGTDINREPVTYTDQDENGKYRIQVHYDEVSTILFKLNEDGSIGRVCDIYRHEPEFRGGEIVMPHAHSVKLSPDGNYFLVCDMGTDKISMFSIDYTAENLCLAENSPYQCVEGMGPRYSAFHPYRPYCFVNMEKQPMVSSFSYNKKGVLTKLDTIRIVPENMRLRENDLQSGFTISPEGKYLYTLLRGRNIIVVIKINEDDGKLSVVQTCKLKGEIPKDCMISPDGRLLAVANRGSGDIEFWKVGKDGLLSESELRINKDRAGFVYWIVQ